MATPPCAPQEYPLLLPSFHPSVLSSLASIDLFSPLCISYNLPIHYSLSPLLNSFMTHLLWVCCHCLAQVGPTSSNQVGILCIRVSCLGSGAHACSHGRFPLIFYVKLVYRGLACTDLVTRLLHGLLLVRQCLTHIAWVCCLGIRSIFEVGSSYFTGCVLGRWHTICRAHYLLVWIPINGAIVSTLSWVAH